MPPEISRNDPCPCGSGRKYKKCCFLKEQASRPLTKELLGEASKKAASLLLDFELRFPRHPDSRPLSMPVPEMPSEEAQNALHSEMLLPWILYLWHPQEVVSQTLPSDQTVAARFLEQEGHILDGITRRFIEAARSEPFSYWQVEGVSPGVNLLLKDMATGHERVVPDVSCSNLASRWDIFFAQVVGLDETYVFNAMGIYPLSPYRFREKVSEFIRGITRQAASPLDRHDLLKYQRDFVSHYLRCVEEVLHPKLPELRNTDGDKLVFAKSRYTFDASERTNVLKAVAALDDIEDRGKEGNDASFVWLALPKEAGHKNRVAKARISIGHDWLETDCNSEARDKALRKRLLRSLGSLLTHENTNLKPFHPDKAMEQSADSTPDTSGPLDLTALPEGDRKRIEAFLEKQHLSWADETVPMLGNITPRQAVRTSKAKKQVADMINDWENMQGKAQNPQFRFDFNKLRAELGIDLE